jgi:hypothetical protein
MYRYKNIGILFVQSDNFVYLCHETLVKELKGEKVLVLDSVGNFIYHPDRQRIGQLVPKALIDRMTQAVHDFVGDAEQSDDLTMLVVQYHKHD